MEDHITKDQPKASETQPVFNDSVVSVDGKRSILPAPLLLNLKTLVQEQHTDIVQQIISTGGSSKVSDEIDDHEDEASIVEQTCGNQSAILQDIETGSDSRMGVVVDGDQEDALHDGDKNNISERISREPKTCNPDPTKNELFSRRLGKFTQTKKSVQDSGDATKPCDNAEESGKKKREAGLSPTRQPKNKKQRPNYFIGVQITDPEIHDVAKKVQSAIQDTYDFSIDLAITGSHKFHITLMVMHLANKEDLQRAASALEKCVPPILEKTCGQQVKLPFEGVSAFGGGRVVFAGLKPSEGLDQLHFMSDEIHRNMADEGILTTDKKRDFNPHMTLIKFKGDRKLLKLGFKKVTAERYEPFLTQVFGTQSISSLQLCSMDRKREDGYYFVDHEVFFPIIS